MYTGKYSRYAGGNFSARINSPDANANKNVTSNRFFMLLYVIAIVFFVSLFAKPVFADDDIVDNVEEVVVENVVEAPEPEPVQVSEPVVESTPEPQKQEVQSAPEPAVVSTPDVQVSEPVSPPETNSGQSQDITTPSDSNQENDNTQSQDLTPSSGENTDITPGDENNNVDLPDDSKDNNPTDVNDEDPNKNAENPESNIDVPDDSKNNPSVDEPKKDNEEPSSTKKDDDKKVVPEKSDQKQQNKQKSEKIDKENVVDIIQNANKKKNTADKKKNDQKKSTNITQEPTNSITQSETVITFENVSNTSQNSTWNTQTQSGQATQYQTITRASWIRTLTPYQRLIVNMKSTQKIPAIINSGGSVSIRDGRGESYNEIGTIPEGGLCYVLEEGNWSYIESGEVRGFVPSSRLITGDEAQEILAAKGEDAIPKAESVVEPSENDVFSYLKVTTANIPVMPSNVRFSMASRGLPSVKRNAILEYARQFLGRPYVWGGTDLWNGADCSGFVQGVFAHFGIQLPRTSREQCYVGERINPKDAKPGDLLFYAENGRVYHVIIYSGNGMSVQAHSSSKGIVETAVDYGSVCWGTRIIEDEALPTTQAIDLTDTGKKASEGDEEARESIIEALADASENEWETYGFPRSVIIAQTIQESNWLSFQDEESGGITPEDNNVLGMNEELLNDEWESPWTGDSAQRNVAQVEDDEIVYGDEMMRTYDDIESCMDDYAAFKTSMHPELQGETDIDLVIEEGLQGSATDPDYQSSIKNTIEEYDLTKYDEDEEESLNVSTSESEDYTEAQLGQIWAIVALNDDSSYEGALAVITTAANRSDQNFGGYGNDTLSQLTANDDFGYQSLSQSDSYQRRLGGNVPEYVKQAVKDCLENGTRSHMYTNFRSSDVSGEYVQIGNNWYF